MTNQPDISSMNAELHRINNRVRQQRYRARKREEKAKRHGETMLPVDLFSNVTNELPLLKNDSSGSLNPKLLGARNETGSDDFGHCDTDNFCKGCERIPIVAEHVHIKCIEGHQQHHPQQQQQQQQQQQHSNVESFGTITEDDTDVASMDCQKYYSHKILQPLSEMENEKDMSTIKMQDGYVMKFIEQNEHSSNHSDIMARRLKNRERQRRYRARKRLQADMKKANLTNQLTPLHVESQLNRGPNKCQRDWKKDARRAHASEEPEITSPGLLFLSLTVATEDLKQSFPLETKAKPPLEGEFLSEQRLSLTNFEDYGLTHGWRNWKAAARNVE